MHELLALAAEREEQLFRVEDRIICLETHLSEGDVAASRLAERKKAVASFVEWLSRHHSDEVDELVGPSGRFRVFDRSLLGARQRAGRQIALLQEFGATPSARDAKR